MSRLRSAQAQALQRRLFGMLLVSLPVYSVLFAAVALALDTTVFDDLGERIANLTSSWTYYSEDEYVALQIEFADARQSDLLQALPVEGGGYNVRNLGPYYAMRSLKWVVLLGIYLLGCVGMALVVMRSSVKRFDDLACAITALFADREAKIILPDSLAIVRAELLEVRERSLADERVTRAAETRKNELVAYLAHDIKTPLTSVLGYLTLLKESPDIPRTVRAEYAGIALSKAERLDDLIDEFFEITRYNLQAIPVERQRISAQLLCQQVADELFPEANAKDVTIDVDVPDDFTLFIDPDKMARALSNVMRNAVAYADVDTCVNVRVRIDEHKATFLVTDQGREISPVHLQSIFEKFFREDTARSSNKGGAGLGLAIAKEIVVAHGGSISAQSEAGTTTFFIVVPV
ncbi:sensor histidine kinase [Adlercreutzia sp. ZJ141]|uniref:sensor histidine kinase n=1 Tax=Adlercreutzia sp. ZJ141 TaxID=2709406 RepID=UPI0013ED66BA|nr:HAMP domain-containing sensor histidine kinase [Adlercreutzia sp. ZJ141]